jgi:aspartyl protease family protein
VARRGLRAGLNALLILSGLVAPSARATEVLLAGLFPGKALMVIDGHAPRSVEVGATSPEGVKVLSVDRDGANVEADGRRLRLEVGQSAINVGSRGGTGEIRLQADSAGHFMTQGAVNGASMQFIVDTGASLISIGHSDAMRAGIDYLKGKPNTSMTANGVINVWLVTLDTVKVGDVTLRNVPAFVHNQDMPFALLGMSFLNRMDMRRDGSVMNLHQRY